MKTRTKTMLLLMLFASALVSLGTSYAEEPKLPLPKVTSPDITKGAFWSTITNGVISEPKIAPGVAPTGPKSLSHVYDITATAGTTVKKMAPQRPAEDGLEFADPPPKFEYIYRATITKITDGDTINADIDLGFKTWIHGVSLRIARVYAPEIFKPKDSTEKKQGQLVTGYLAQRLQIGESVTIVSIKDSTEKYGRYLAEIWDDQGNVNNGILEFMTENKIPSNKRE